MLATRTRRRTTVIGGTFAVAAIIVLSSCTPSGYVGAKGTVAYQARKLGISLSSSSVSCAPVPNDQFLHNCTAPVGAGGAKVVLKVRVGSITTPTESTEQVVSTIPASLARGSLKRTEPGYSYVTQCGWKKGAGGKWDVDPTSPPRTFLVDADGQGIKEI